MALIGVMGHAAAAQSVLNFARASYSAANDTGVAITNPTPYDADIRFTLFGLDGNPVSGVTNPVNYRVAPKSQLQMLVSDLFMTGTADGWIQATSSASGLIGFSFSGDFVSTEYGAETSTALLAQAIPVIREDLASGVHTDLFIDNPQSVNANVAITLYGPNGAAITTFSQSIPPHGGINAAANFPSTGLPAASAMVTSSVPVIATAAVNSRGANMLVIGQPVDQSATTRVAPHFVSMSGIDSQLVLSNPNATPASVTVTLLSLVGGLVHPAAAGPKSVVIPAHGLVALDTGSLTGLPINPAVDGWVEIDSGSLALNGAVVLSAGPSLTAIPLLPAPATTMTFSQLSDNGERYGELDLVNPLLVDASVTLSLMQIDGTVVVQSNITVPAHSKLSARISDLIPDAAGVTGGFVFARSSSGIYGVEMLGRSGYFVTTVSPQRINLDFTPNPSPNLPRIVSIRPGTAVRANSSVRIEVNNSSSDLQVLLGNLTLTPQPSGPFGGNFDFDIPSTIETGFANLRVRTGGLESPPISLRILPADNQPLSDITGQAFYQKVAVTDAGLDLSQTSMSAIRNARVEVRDLTGNLISVTETDVRGEFTAAVPPGTVVSISVLSRLRSSNLAVEDNSNNGALYKTSVSFDPRTSNHVVLAETSRVAGAFNILEMIQQGNDLLHLADPKIIPPTPTIFWSIKNTLGTSNANGLIGINITHFSLATNTAFILGDRNLDSDEFDDSVIIHEYAHMLAAAFSRDDSPGGVHGIGNMEDPRLAWSEGWANFFSGAARNNSVYLDSMVLPSGPTALRIDLEENIPAGDRPGYWSEGSVGSLLWDMFDDQPDTGDTVQYPFAQIWPAITGLTSYRFVYLPYFLQAFLARNPSEADPIRTMAQLRSIDFQPSVTPSVTNPFPRPISVGDIVNGDQVDSLTAHRTNLATSSHFYSFTTTAAMITIRMDITGLGTGNNPNFNDLDLFLMDLNGHVINLSDSGLNGQSEFIAQKLAAGTYVIEVRSYYTNADTSGVVYNSGQYRLSLLSPSGP